MKEVTYLFMGILSNYIPIVIPSNPEGYGHPPLSHILRRCQRFPRVGTTHLTNGDAIAPLLLSKEGFTREFEAGADPGKPR